MKESTQIHQEYSLKLNTQQDSKAAADCSPSAISPQHINGCGLLQHFKLKSLVDFSCRDSGAVAVLLWHGRRSVCTCRDKVFQMFPTEHVLAEAGSQVSSCVILQYDKFYLKTHVKMPFVPLPRQADLRSVIGFYLEYMTLCRKSQSLEKDKCRYSDEVGRGLSRSAAQVLHRAGEHKQHCLSVRNWAGSSNPTWLHSQRIFQWLSPACSGFKKLQHKFVSLLLTAMRTIRKGFPSRWEITDRKETGTSLQSWLCLHHVLCPRESQQCWG